MKRSILYGALVIVIFGLCGPSKSRAQGAYLELGTVKKYKKTVVVCPVGSPEENGSLLLDAIAGITDAGADNPYLVELEPGVYNTSDVPTRNEAIRGHRGGRRGNDPDRRGDQRFL